MERVLSKTSRVLGNKSEEILDQSETKIKINQHINGMEAKRSKIEQILWKVNVEKQV
jgi:hypothetical protein